MILNSMECPTNRLIVPFAGGSFAVEGAVMIRVSLVESKIKRMQRYLDRQTPLRQPFQFSDLLSLLSLVSFPFFTSQGFICRSLVTFFPQLSSRS